MLLCVAFKGSILHYVPFVKDRSFYLYIKNKIVTENKILAENKRGVGVDNRRLDIKKHVYQADEDNILTTFEFRNP